MLMPGIFANDLMDGFFDAPERNYKKSYYNSGLMKTDIERKTKMVLKLSWICRDLRKRI